MKKAVVLNELKRTEQPIGCASVFSKPDPLEVLKSDIKRWETKCAEQFNQLGSQGYELRDERIYGYDVLDNSQGEKSNASFGVYLFEQGASTKYSVYMGPLVVLPKPSSGCGEFKMPGCKAEKQKEKSKGCNLGCNQAKTTDEQYLNFFNNVLNTDSVKAINAHNGWRTDYNPDRDDFVYSSFETSNEDVLTYWNLIQQQFDRDMEQLNRSGVAFERNILLPCGDQNFSGGLLFSSKNSAHLSISSASSMKAFLSGFELMYLKAANKSLLDTLAMIPVLNILILILRMILGGEKGKVDKTAITDANRRKIEQVFESDFQRQNTLLSQIESTKQSMVGKMRVIFAVPIDVKRDNLLMMIIDKIFPPKTEYNLVTTEIDLTHKK